MNNESIHKNTIIRKIVEDLDYKGGIRRDGLTKDDLSYRIIESSLTAAPEDCQIWIPCHTIF
jgi:hypothetical protein